MKDVKNVQEFSIEANVIHGDFLTIPEVQNADQVNGQNGKIQQYPKSNRN